MNEEMREGKVFNCGFGLQTQQWWRQNQSTRKKKWPKFFGSAPIFSLLLY